jgi:hypothetical protein
MPSSIAFFISGESLLASKVLPGPILILAKRAINSVSDGSVGQNRRRKFRILKHSGLVFSSSGVSG